MNNLFCLFAMSLLLCVACASNDTPSMIDTDDGVDTETDSNSDADADLDSDTDADSDADSESDAGSDSAIDTDSDYSLDTGIVGDTDIGTSIDSEKLKNHLLNSAAGAQGEEIPTGVPLEWNWVYEATAVSTTPPSATHTSMNYWGAVFRGPSDTTPLNTVVEVRNCSLRVLYDGASQWVEFDQASSLGGRTYSTTYNSGGPDPSIMVNLDNGIDVVPASGYIWHFWPQNGYQPYGPQPIAEVIANCQSRLVLKDNTASDDRADSDYLIHLGIDWRDPADHECANNNYVCISMGVSRMEKIQPDWRNHTFHSLTAADIDTGVLLPPSEFFVLPAD